MLFRGFTFDDRSPEHTQPVKANFYFQTNCIVYLFEQFLPKMYFDDVYCVRFECFPEAQLHCGEIEMDGVLTVQIPYQVSDFYKLSDVEKKKKTLDLLMQGVQCVIQEKGWNAEPFLIAYAKTKEKAYQFKKTYKKPKSSPNRKLKAKIEIEIGLYESSATLIVEDKMQTELAKTNIHTTIPRWELLYDYLGDLKWIDNETVRVYERYSDNKKYTELKVNKE